MGDYKEFWWKFPNLNDSFSLTPKYFLKGGSFFILFKWISLVSHFTFFPNSYLRISFTPSHLIYYIRKRVTSRSYQFLWNAVRQECSKIKGVYKGCDSPVICPSLSGVLSLHLEAETSVAYWPPSSSLAPGHLQNPEEGVQSLSLARFFILWLIDWAF